MEEVCSTIDYVHGGLRSGGRPLLHCDLKPANIIIGGADGKQPTLVDWSLLSVGECRMLKGGTAGYLAPESVDKGYTIKTDNFAVGALLWFILTRQNPPERYDEVLLRSHLDEALRKAGIANRNALVNLVMTMMAKDSKHRPASATKWFEPLRQRTTDPPAVDQRTKEAARRRVPRWTVVSMAVLLLFVAGAVGTQALYGSRRREPLIMTTPSTSAIPPGSVFYEERFSDSASRWTQRESEREVVRYVDGQYRVTLKARPSATFASAPPTGLPGASRIEVKATKLSSALGSFGVFCRANGDSRYRGLVDVNGEWRIERVDGRAIRRLDKGVAEGVPSPGSYDIALECVGGDEGEGPVVLKLVLNGKAVSAEVRDGSNGLASGRAGVEVVSNLEEVRVAFDDFVVRRL